MTTNQPEQESRLDRIERILELQAERQTAQQEALDAERIERQAWYERVQQLVESNSRAIAANSDAARQSREEMRASITDLVNMITTQADQAEIDRAEFRATVQQLLEALGRRFTSNGH